MNEPAVTRLDEDPIDRRVFYPLLLVGLGCVAYGVRALHERNVPLEKFAVWFVGALVVHDVVLAPLLVVAGGVVSRRVARPWRWAVQVGALIGGVVLLFVLPALVGDGRDPGDPSRLPNDYGSNLAFVLAAIAVVVVALALVRRRRGREAPFSAPGPED